MSGGVDSSVAALLLQRAGHELVSVFMRNGVAGKSAQEKSCCSASDARDAAVVADRLGMPFYAVDYAAEFGALMDHFAAEYRRGRTPNPCVLCNQQLKFGQLFRVADDVGADAVATGHYARVVDGELRLARDANKDQTYYLFGIERAALARTLFPLGELTKPEVRALANEAGLVTAEKPESMEICFVTSGDYRDVVRARGGGGTPGRFVARDGRGSASTTASTGSRSANARACRRSARRTSWCRSTPGAVTSRWCRATACRPTRWRWPACTGSSMRRATASPSVRT